MTKIALIQTNSRNDLSANLIAIIGWVEAASQAGAEAVFLPENCLFMGANAQELHAHAAENDTAIAALQACAKQCSVALHLGSVARLSHIANKLYNQTIVIDADGDIIARYNKIHLYKADVIGGESHDENRNYTAGDQTMLVDSTAGKIGLSICYDLRFAHLYRSLAQAGAELLSVPAAFMHKTGEAHWHVLLRARAIETGCFVVAAAQTGKHPAGRNTYGHSMVVNPWGKVIAELPHDTGVLLCDVDVGEVKAARAQLPSLQHDREFV